MGGGTILEVQRNVYCSPAPPRQKSCPARTWALARRQSCSGLLTSVILSHLDPLLHPLPSPPSVLPDSFILSSPRVFLNKTY